MRGVWASSVESSAASGKSRGLFGRFPGERDSSFGADGSGASAVGPQGRSLSRLLAVAAVFVAALLMVPVANAARGITGFNSEIGTVNSATGIAVNGSGVGGPAPGDYFTADEATFFDPEGGIQQFSATGEFKRIFGDDVVASGPGNADETQSVSIFATGGTFTLTFGGEVTTPIDFDASAGDVEAALNALSSIGGVGASVAVTGGPGNASGSNPYLVTFGGVQADANQPLLTADSSSLTGAGATTFIAATNEGGTGREICIPANGDTCQGSDTSYTQITIDQSNGDLYTVGSNSVQRFTALGEWQRAFGNDVVLTGPNDSNVDEQQQLVIEATGGTFALRIFVPDMGQQQTGPIPYDAAPGVVESELNDLAGIGTSGGGAFNVTGGPGGAGGGTPYVITFGGVNAGDNTREFTAIDSALTGTPRSATITTLVEGGAPEVCTLSDVCKEGANSGSVGSTNPAAAFNSTNAALSLAPGGAPNAGNVLVADGSNRRVQEFTADGQFVRAFGWDVVAAGGPGDDTGTQPVQVFANGGSFTLTFDGQTTSSMPYNVDDATMEAELNGLSSIGGVGGSVTVTGGPGSSNGSNPYVVVFGGTLAGSPPLMTSDSSALTNSTFNDPEAYVGTGFEVCVPANGDTCRSGIDGTGVGQFSGRLRAVAEDSTGAIYTVDGPRGSGGGGSVNYRVLKFTSAGGTDLTASTFGETETQELTVNAGSGDFRIGIPDADFASATGSFSNGQFTITNVNFLSGEFRVGQPYNRTTEAAGTRVTGVGANTVSISNPIQSGCGGCTFTAADYTFTPDLPAAASAAQVEAALNALGPISEAGGSVSVSGGPGGPGGGTPYVITFDGGVMSGTDQPELIAVEGTTPLSGGTGGDANQASVATPTAGGPNGRTDGGFSGISGDDEETPIDIAIGPADEIYVLKNFRPGWGVCDNGLLAGREIRVMEFLPSGEQVETSRACTHLEKAGNQDEPQRVTVNPTTGELLVLQTLTARDPDTDQFTPRIYKFGEVGAQPDLTLDPPSNLSSSGATISGSIDPNGPGPVEAHYPSATTYRVEYKPTSEADWEIYAPDVSVGTGDSPVPFSVGVSGLTPKVEYEARVIVTKPFGFEQIVQQTAPFETLAAAPVINAFSSSSITANSANLHALINPLGTATSYHFEYGKTPAYGQSTPETDIGDSLTPVSVTEQIENLDPVVYHFRVVATNSEGTTVSTNQTFNFYPEPCPNSAVRQQTGSSSLPDCRAYELVSPEFAGSASLIPGGPNSPEASNPPRFAYSAGLGAIPGPWNASNNVDPYMATRTSTGWQTFYIGIPADEAGATTGPPNSEGTNQLEASLSMDRVIGWNPGHQGFTCCAQTGSMAPYVFGPQGQDLGRWPTNVQSVTGGLKSMSCWLPGKPLTCGPPGGFAGDLRPSADFDHYFFSSGNVEFATGGQTSGIGSVYDNEIATGEVSIASKDTNGDDIEPEPGVTADDYMALPAADRDGSHILMAASATGISGNTINEPMPFPCGWGDGGFDHGLTIQDCPDLLPSHLYMRVNGNITYDVSQGNIVDFQGMTGDGTTVYFTSDEQLAGDDNDTSTDLFKWSQDTDSISLVTIGTGGVGDSDACNASWTGKCGIEIASPETAGGFFGYALTNNGVARETGDVYFYSPEQFVGSNGIPGRRNLYVARGGSGEIQYVATLEPNEAASRMQVTPDGNFAAFITPSRLTPYDNAGFDMMYRYDAVNDTLRCESCLPSGDPPTGDASGSDNGLYISDDGRTFWNTDDALVAQDTNGLNDVYEFVGGRPQLITTGIAAKDETRLAPTGLVGVSANGVDVYFSTTETLVEEDGNGAFLKFYDARTNGGFSNQPEAAPCAAADECHGDGTEGNSTPRFGSTANLGQAGNVAANRCTRLGRVARVLVRRAKANRNRIKRTARSSGRVSRRKILRLRKRARTFTRRARKTSTRAKRCRATARRARANRRAGK